MKGTFNPSPRCGFSHQKHTDKNHVDRLCKNMTDDDRALLVLYSSKQESLKASSTSVLIGKKRKEATATETRAYQKQFHEAKLLECKSWLDNKVFDLVDTRKIHVRRGLRSPTRRLARQAAPEQVKAVAPLTHTCIEQWANTPRFRLEVVCWHWMQWRWRPLRLLPWQDLRSSWWIKTRSWAE